MKRIAVLLILTLSIFTFAAQSQNCGAAPPGHQIQMLSSPDAFADGHLAALDKQVGLSPEQRTKARAVFLQEGEDLFAVFGDGSLSDAQKQARIQQLHVSTQSKVWNLLTHEQRKQMSESPAPPRPVT
jgi:Spy/CpxP family protein refolding chaperone